MSRPRTTDSPLDNQLFRLRFPRSLGTYASYADVQAVVDALADEDFAVENTMIVGTDLRLVERVTGRRSWGRVIGGGILSGAWMGLFIGLLFSMLSEQALTTLVSSVVLGIVFFTVWAAIGYALSGGRRDFTSTTATIPMQYELLVEHSVAEEARRLLAAAGPSLPRPVTSPGGAGAPEQAASSSPRPAFGGRASYGQPAPERTEPPRAQDPRRED